MSAYSLFAGSREASYNVIPPYLFSRCLFLLLSLSFVQGSYEGWATHEADKALATVLEKLPVCVYH